ncbi:SH3 domain-containing protein [Ancylobacter sp.]|uniref:SH3 domain-containing protein n=1 Tax=Ancylobacter sp. TaxID=1872567 RepID=UPI003D10E10F
MYATANVNIRAQPSTSADVLGQATKGTSILVLDKQGDWYQIMHGDKSGWVSAGYVSPSPPTEREPERPMRTQAPTTVAPAVRAFSGRAVRAPYVGTCDCPYDLKRNGARCGGSSAYSRPGGREPDCYE